MYKLYYTNRAKKDAQLIKASNLKSKAEELLSLIAQDPYAYPPEFEFLKGDLKGAISRRIVKMIYRKNETNGYENSVGGGRKRVSLTLPKPFNYLIFWQQ